MTMAETVIRKACDRCHAQKLSCKRYNDEPCERCVRLKTECKSIVVAAITNNSNNNLSNSLKLVQPRADAALRNGDGRTARAIRVSSHPTRVRAIPPMTPFAPGEDIHGPCLSSREHRLISVGEAVPIVPHTGDLASKCHLAVTPEPPVVDTGDFNFTFDQLAFFAAPHAEQQHLSHPGLPGGVDPHFADSWDPRLYSSAVEPYSSTVDQPYPPPPLAVAPEAFSHHLLHHAASAVPPEGPLSDSRSCAPEHSSSDKRSRPRTKQRPRQITLRHDLDLSPLQPDVPPIHWMALLSDINARLLELASALPSPQEAAQNGSLLGRPVDERFRSQGFPIEDMFKLTRRVADILERPPSDTPDRDGSKPHHSIIDGSDPGNAMFILSTYVRLLDMYQKVFGLVHTELSQTDSGATFSFWKLPDVTVGSFAVESSPFLQMSLTIQLAEEFLSRLRGSTARWSGAGAASMFAGVVDVSFQAFRDREEALAKHLVELRSEIEPLLDS
ncbi:hypothetical protein FZEAL_6068 [Fusarium zealandicum]|uniref:Zn(2)-C6 fungal-type domain-containing protein n=1 Tax=Fusarium zealandicum TaxID=1053134 RepID=A0A8H4UJ24_9HYPO|nr:hypothetical protein FZEAL_6068 [Fusarium zealandicum]